MEESPSPEFIVQPDDYNFEIPESLKYFLPEITVSLKLY